MGSELYRARVERVARGTVVLRVTTVHPDAGPPAPGARFPVSLLVDLWDLLESGCPDQIGGPAPATADEAVALASRAPWGTVFRRLRGLAHGIEEPASEADIAALVKAMGAGERPTLEGRPVGSWGVANGRPYVVLAADDAAFAAAVADLIGASAQDQPEHQEAYGAWPDGRRSLPRVRITVTFKDPALVGFMRPRMVWGSAAF